MTLLAWSNYSISASRAIEAQRATSFSAGESMEKICFSFEKEKQRKD